MLASCDVNLRLYKYDWSSQVQAANAQGHAATNVSMPRAAKPARHGATLKCNPNHREGSTPMSGAYLELLLH